MGVGSLTNWNDHMALTRILDETRILKFLVKNLWNKTIFFPSTQQFRSKSILCRDKAVCFILWSGLGKYSDSANKSIFEMYKCELEVG